MVNLRVLLLEKRKDYLNSFKLNMQHPSLRKKIFIWIDRTLEKLSADRGSAALTQELKSEIQKKVRDLIQLDIGSCVVMIDTWFEDTY